VKLSTAVKLPVVIGLSLIILFSTPLALSAPISAATTAAGPNLKLENFKWQDILGSSFALDPESSVGQITVGASIPVNKSKIVFNQVGQMFVCLLTKIAGTDKSGKPYGKSTSAPGPVVQVIIWWSQDTQAIGQVAGKYFDDLTQTQETKADELINGVKDSSGKTIPSDYKLITEQGSKESARMLWVFRDKFTHADGSQHVDLVGFLDSASSSAFISVSGLGLEPDFNEGTAAGLMTRLEQRARDLLGLMSMELNHYHPFTAANVNHHVGGDVVATLSKNGALLPGQKVYFFLNMKSSSALTYDPGCFVLPNLGASFAAGGPFASLSHEFAIAETNQSGEATFNYLTGGLITNGALKPLLLAQILDRHRGFPAVFGITAVVFDKDPIAYWSHDTTEEPRAEVISEVKISFDSIARITKIIPTDPVQHPAPFITVKSPGATPYVQINATQVNGVVSQPDSIAGYPLNLNDSVLPNQYSSVMIQWITGTTLLFSPKLDWDWKNNGEVSVTIGYKDSGMYDRINASALYFWGMGASGFLGFYASCKGLCVAAAPFWGWASAAWGLIGCVGISVSVYDKYENPMIVQYKSQILFDLGENSTIYTVEGTATYFSIDDHSKIDVTTGHKLQFTAEGKAGTAATFKDSDLNADMASLLKTMQKELPAASLTPTITSKSSAPSSSNPQPNTNKLLTKSTTSSKLKWILIFGVSALVLIIAVLLVKRRGRQAVTASPTAPSIPLTISGPVAPSQPTQSNIPPRTAPGRFCNRCGNQVSDTNSYCVKCGAMLSLMSSTPETTEAKQALFCPKCGKQTQMGKKFCGRCGTALSPQTRVPDSRQHMPLVSAYCPKCGKPNTTRGNYCENCGSNLMG